MSRSLSPGRWRLAAVPAAALLIICLSYPWWLPWFGAFLVSGDTPRKSDAIFVLAGDHSGNRIRRAAGLAQQGYAPLVLVSGPSVSYGHNEADLAISLMTREGYPPALFEAVRMRAFSTAEEAQGFLGAVQNRSLRSLIVVTSDFHSARTKRVFQRTLPNLELLVVTAPDTNFRLPDWWSSRESRKTVFLEWTKTIADWLRL